MPVALRATSGSHQPLRRASLRSNPASSAHRPLAAVLAGSVLALAGVPAHALDGCLVLLCLGAPSWRAIPQCVPPIRQLFHDLARGRPFPTCAMAGAGNHASHAWAQAPAYCPPQYTRVSETESGPTYACDYAGAISVTIQGTLFARTWWSIGGSVTEFTPAAKAQLGRWDTRFDDDYAAWMAATPPAPPAPEASN